MEKRKFSLKQVPNYVIALVMFLVFVIFIFFDKNVGYVVFSKQLSKIDTLTMECDELRQQILDDSLVLDAISDSTKLDRYLHEKMLFVGEGETMYQIVEHGTN